VRGWLLPFLLADARVDCDRGEIALAQELVQLGGSDRALHEDDDLVELELVEQLVELTVLLLLIQLDVVLLETMECQLRLVVDVNLKRVLHELLANRSHLLRESSAEHHHLLLGRGSTEDLLDITAHVCGSQYTDKNPGRAPYQ
jgi:hypothetical protein